MLLRNRMLGGMSPLALMAPEGVDGAGEDKHTDVVLQEIAAKAFDDAAAAADTGETAEAEAPEKAASAAKADPEAKDAGTVEKTSQESKARGDRGDGRAPDGTFVKKSETEAKSSTAKTNGAAPEAEQVSKAVPPGGWSVASKTAWNSLPQSVRDDVAKREMEVSNGFRQYEGLKPFAERATRAGQSLAQALQAYTGIEDLIRRDFSSGVMHIAQNAGLTQHEAASAFAQIAQRLGFQFQAPLPQGDGGSAGAQPPAADPNALRQLLEPILGPVVREVNTLKTTLTSRAEGEHAQRQTAAQRTVEAFRQSPEGRYYDNLEEMIGDFLEKGVVPRTGDLAADLKTAYDYAARIHPEVSEALLNERLAADRDSQRSRDDQAAQRARAASRSVTGAPPAGARETSRRSPGDQLRSLAEQAYDQAAGRV